MPRPHSWPSLRPKTSAPRPRIPINKARPSQQHSLLFTMLLLSLTLSLVLLGSSWGKWAGTDLD